MLARYCKNVSQITVQLAPALLCCAAVEPAGGHSHALLYTIPLPARLVRKRRPCGPSPRALAFLLRSWPYAPSASPVLSAPHHRRERTRLSRPAPRRRARPPTPTVHPPRRRSSRPPHHSQASRRRRPSPARAPTRLSAVSSIPPMPPTAQATTRSSPSPRSIASPPRSCASRRTGIPTGPASTTTIPSACSTSPAPRSAGPSSTRTSPPSPTARHSTSITVSPSGTPRSVFTPLPPHPLPTTTPRLVARRAATTPTRS